MPPAPVVALALLPDHSRLIDICIFVCLLTPVLCGTKLKGFDVEKYSGGLCHLSI